MILVLKIGEKEGGIAFFEKQLVFKEKFIVNKTLSGVILEIIEKFFRKNKIKNLKGIILSINPNTFTSQRIGITIANTFYLTHKTPLCLIPKEISLEKAFRKGQRNLAKKLLKPIYLKKPNITKGKPRTSRPAILRDSGSEQALRHSFHSGSGRKKI